MRTTVLAILITLLAFSGLTQESAPKWQKGTVMAVEPHTAKQGESSDVTRYDISVKVGDTTYVVLYTSKNSADPVKYRAGVELPVLIEKDTLTFNDLLGRQKTLPILRRETTEARKEQ